MEITDAKTLGEALKTNTNTLELEGDLAKKVIRIKATGTVAWVIAIGAIGAAITAIVLIPTSAGISTPASATVVATMIPTVATALGGFSVASIAISIAIAGGGVAALNKLRKYNLEKIDDNHIRLIRKN